MSERDEPKLIHDPIRLIMEELHQKLEKGGLESDPPRRSEPCPRCKGSGYVLGREGAISVATLCGCDRRCRKCNGRGILLRERDGYEFAQPCECQTLTHRVSAYNAAQLPARFAEKGFEQFYASREDPPQLGKAKRLMSDFANTARPGFTPRGSGLFGKPGTGKTHLLVATLARMTLERGLACRYIEISFLFADLKAAISDPRARATVDKIDDLAEIDVLAIDELGKGRGSVFEEEVLDELIGRRYNNGKLTLFATNFSREATSAAPHRDGTKPELASQSLRLRVGERVYSRLHEMVDFIDLPPSTRDRRIPPS